MTRTEPVEHLIELVDDITTRQARLICRSEASADRDRYLLSIDLGGERVASSSTRSCFDALRQLRLQLEARGILVRCNGSCENVYPSPMIEEMGDGDRAYRLSLGKPAALADLVDIFALSDLAAPATIASQEAFYQRWLRSLAR